MWLLIPLALAHASEPPPFPRHDETLLERRFARLAGEGPAWGVTRQSKGAVQAWIFGDGIVEHANLTKSGVVQETRRYAAGGQPLTTVRYTEGAPTEVELYGSFAAKLDVTAWSEAAAGPATTRLPPGVRFETLPVTGDPFDPEFVQGLLDTCGCRLEHGETTWLDGRVGARLRVAVPQVGAPLTGELWVVALSDQTLVVSSFVPARSDGAPEGGLTALAPGRAAAALVRIEESE